MDAIQLSDGPSGRQGATNLICRVLIQFRSTASCALACSQRPLTRRITVMARALGFRVTGWR